MHLLNITMQFPPLPVHLLFIEQQSLLSRASYSHRESPTTGLEPAAAVWGYQGLINPATACTWGGSVIKKKKKSICSYSGELSPWDHRPCALPARRDSHLREFGLCLVSPISKMQSLNQGLKAFGFPCSLHPLDSQPFPSLPHTAQHVPWLWYLGKERSHITFHLLGSLWGCYEEFHFSIVKLNTLITSIISFSCPLAFPSWKQKAFVPYCRAGCYHNPGLLLPSQPEERAAWSNQCLDVISTQMRSSSDKEMEKGFLFYFILFCAEFASPVQSFSAWKFTSEIGLLCPSSCTVHFLAMLSKISNNSTQEKCCTTPGSQKMSVIQLITSQLDCSA